MSDFERMTGHVTRDVAHSTQWPEPGEVRARAGRRTARQAVLATVTAVVVLAAVTFAIGAGRGGTTEPAVPTPPGPVPTPSAAVPTTPPSPTPSNFLAQKVSFVDKNTGWALGVQSCAAGSCLALRRTIDGGHSWTTLPAPPADVPAEGSSIRFADAEHGYLFARAVLYLTADGGATWIPQAGGAFALEVANGTALRISTGVGDCSPGCPFRIATAPVGSSDWHAVKAYPGSDEVDLVRTGHQAVILIVGHFTGGAMDARAVRLTSSDDGATWTTRPDPCGTTAEGGIVATQIVSTSDGSVTVVCYQRSQGTTEVTTSTDGGVTFGPRRATPPNEISIGAASTTTLFVSTLDANSAHLRRSDDGGATWRVVATDPNRVADGTVPPGPVTFLADGRTGWWVPGRATVFSTSDGGLTWTPQTIP
jgi:photosystem II stability/assembly factor-like uncharacterized protein